MHGALPRRTGTHPARMRSSHFKFAAYGILTLACAAINSAVSLAQTVTIEVPATVGTASASPPPTTSPIARDLPHALEIARTLRRDRETAIEIVLAPGLHRLDAPVLIGPQDSGTPDHPLVLRGAANGQTIVKGSVQISPEPGLVSGYERLPPAARMSTRLYRLPARLAPIRQVDTARPQSLAILVERFMPTLAPSVPFEIFDQKGALRPARWPNTGWAAADGPGTGSGTGEEWWTLNLAAPRIEAWRGEPDLWTAGYWKWDYSYERHRVSGIRAPALGPPTLRLTTPFVFGLKPGARASVYHALAELDQPGEWYRDHERNVLLAWPPTSDPRLEVSIVETAFAISGASHIRIADLTIERFHGDAVRVSGGRDVIVERSTLRWAGMRGATFLDARDSGVVSSDIEDTGEGGVLLAGGDRTTLTPARMFVRNSRIVRFARIAHTFKPGIDIMGVGNIAAHNYIAEAPHLAIQVQGNDHLVDSNEITDVVNDTTDSSALYTGHDWTAGGTVIRNNFIHDLRGRRPGFETKGVYLDDFTSGVTVSANLFLRVEQPVFIGGGRDNIVESNVFIAAEPAIHIDSRGEDWAAQYVTNPTSDLRRRLTAVPTASATWRKRYPSLAQILRDEPAVAKRNVSLENTVIGGKPYFFETRGDPKKQILTGLAPTGEISIDQIATLTSRATANDVGRWITATLPAGSAARLPFATMDRARRAGRAPAEK